MEASGVLFLQVGATFLFVNFLQGLKKCSQRVVTWGSQKLLVKQRRHPFLSQLEFFGNGILQLLNLYILGVLIHIQSKSSEVT